MGSPLYRWRAASLSPGDVAFQPVELHHARSDSLFVVPTIAALMTVSTYRLVSMTLNTFGVQILPTDEGLPDVQ